jgi:hypothetical protein
MPLITYLFIVIFFIGLYFYSRGSDIEAFSNNVKCPNLLIQKDSRFYLYNSKLAKVPGVNPVEFDNLEDYTEFLDWQKSQGIKCPVLYLQQTYDTQGNQVYKARPSVSEPRGGLPPSIGINPNPTPLVDATRNDQPYNKGSMPGYDQTDYYVGTTTPLDQMNEQQANMLYSPDPMDPNWGGAEYTQSLVDRGYYAENEISIAVS